MAKDKYAKVSAEIEVATGWPWAVYDKVSGSSTKKEGSTDVGIQLQEADHQPDLGAGSQNES